MRISIIIPIYNAEETIERCLDSFLAQTFTNYEVILVDDGSKDKSGEICKNYAKRDFHFSYYFKGNEGVSSARNEGLRQCKGEIIGFCDADDIVHPQLLEIVNKIFTINNYDLVIVGFVKMFESEVKDYRWSIIQDNLHTIDYSVREITKKVIADESIMGSVWNKYWRRELLENKNFELSLSYCEDMHFIINILSNNQEIKIKYVNEKLYAYIQNSRSVTFCYHKIFSDNGELRYVEALKRILNTYPLQTDEKKLIYSVMFKMATTVLLTFPEMNWREIKMIECYMKEYFRFYIITGEYSLNEKIKNIIKCISILLKRRLRLLINKE